MDLILPNLAIAGYRSFGKDPQYFESFSKINIIIGQNNSGKSNVLRFICEVLRRGEGPLKLDAFAQHFPDHPPALVGRGEDVAGIRLGRVPSRELADDQKAAAESLLRMAFRKKADLDGTTLCWTFREVRSGVSELDQWQRALKTLDSSDLRALWHYLTGNTGGSADEYWIPHLLKCLPLGIGKDHSVELIPATRRIGLKGTEPVQFDGEGLIERLARLQNPNAQSQDTRKRFFDITAFLRDVTTQPDASIEIPYERDTILVHMNGKALPTESLGTGIHEVLILAAAATVLNKTLVCIEEPELHLNPLLQRKLMRYLAAKTDNQYFITTHSAALMDTPGAEIYHVRLNTGTSVVERVTTDEQRTAVCADLGYHPSDLLQANCILWVEGPSDRIYLKWWLEALDDSLIEGIHFSIMFYGGRLLSHLTNAPSDSDVEDFIKLRQLNRRGMILMDSDREKLSGGLNKTKTRLRKEFNIGPGHAWVTRGREVENYLPNEQIREALTAVCPKSTPSGKFGHFDNVLKLSNGKAKTTQAPKVEIARHITKTFRPNLDILDLEARLRRVQKFIRDSNPPV